MIEAAELYWILKEYVFKTILGTTWWFFLSIFVMHISTYIYYTFKARTSKPHKYALQDLEESIRRIVTLFLMFLIEKDFYSVIKSGVLPCMVLVPFMFYKYGDISLT